MKKMLLFAAAAFSLAACTNQTDLLSEPTPQELKIKPVTQKTSRAALDGTYLPKDMSIYVFATRKNDTSYEKWLEDKEFTCLGDNQQANWGAGIIFDPAFPNIELIAYTCDKGNDQKKPNSTTFNIDNDDKQIKSLKIDFSDALEGNTDIMVTDLVSGTNNGGTFSMTFRHALSWVFVNFKAEPDNDDFKIKDVKINEVNLSGALILTPEYSDPTSNILNCKMDWEPFGEKDVYSFPAYKTDDNNGLTLGDAASKLAQGLMIIPGNKTSITFQYCSKEVDNTYSNWRGYQINLTGDWEAGKKYEYIITINSNKIQIYPTATIWDNQTPVENKL